MDAIRLCARFQRHTIGVALGDQSQALSFNPLIRGAMGRYTTAESLGTEPVHGHAWSKRSETFLSVVAPFDNDEFHLDQLFHGKLCSGLSNQESRDKQFTFTDRTVYSTPRSSL